MSEIVKISPAGLAVLKFARKARWQRKSLAIANKVLRTLLERDMKKSDLAAKLGVSSAMVTKYLIGGCNFTLETITKLEDALGVELMQVDEPAFDEKGSINQQISNISVSMEIEALLVNRTTKEKEPNVPNNQLFVTRQVDNSIFDGYELSA